MSSSSIFCIHQTRQNIQLVNEQIAHESLPSIGGGGKGWRKHLFIDLICIFLKDFLLLLIFCTENTFEENKSFNERILLKNLIMIIKSGSNIKIISLTMSL